jgi:hypothetical protein
LNVLAAKGLVSIQTGDYVSGEFLLSALFDLKADGGLYGLFQHAVHLVTVQRVELRTASENFNFIFKNPTDDDI